MKRIGVVIPVLNEEKTIGGIVAALVKRHLPVIVIDDGSSDKSNQLARQAGAHVIYNEKRCGKGYSLKEGFAHALDIKLDGVICMDGDGQHALDDLDGFMTLAQEKDDCVINGNRFTNVQKMPKVRLLTNKLMSALISAACRQKIPDTQCGYRYISASVLRRIKLATNAFEIETEILIKASRAGFKIYSVPVQTIYGDEKSHINPIKDTLKFITYFVKELIAPQR